MSTLDLKVMAKHDDARLNKLPVKKCTLFLKPLRAPVAQGVNLHIYIYIYMYMHRRI